ncbi:hypothetical protein [Methylobacterium sp. JK268]
MTRPIGGQDALAQAVTRAFWAALERNPMPPMAALETAARTVGDLYRQVAALHGDRPVCGCGWRPEPDEDLMRLEAALGVAIFEAAPPLARLPAAGRA